MSFQLGTKQTLLLVEREGFEGVRRIAGKVAGDIEAVTGVRPQVAAAAKTGVQTILCATVGCSPMADALMEAGVLNPSIRGKREVYQIAFAGDTLVICGSDKRGTIYGMFSLSEYIGVTPLCYWGDAAPVRRESVDILPDIETISREPSVKYRGFFINDEWPCFGTWAETHFGDPNADCYDTIFEFLLRMKGNYMWPAMWKASFPLDGPGSANEELADLYGVIMGYSHHEPCLRASEEWDKVRGENSIYGNEWNYYTNEQGLLRYWEDALKRSGKYENIITIGMRGERDTSMLGEDSTLAENIDLLKRIITKQRQLIRTHVKRDAVQMLALYKEVERYFHGDANAEGLKTWRELDDVLFMLCEDNHGHLRTVPPKTLRDHPGGWGMYYHFDYHGGPISYEWVDSTTLGNTWEQMTQAWEYGIRDLWIVNVGDLKLHEVPLTYFLALAYDYDRWGGSNPESPKEYAKLWESRTFPGVDAQTREKIGLVLRDYVMMNSMRRPEALHAGIYHPCHQGETDRMLAVAQSIERRSEEIMSTLNPDQRDAYYSMVHFPAVASANLMKLHLYAGKNHHYAAQGKPIANRYAALTQECIRKDCELAREFGAFKGGKWNGMQLAPHMGFTKWNEDDSRYPVLCTVTPMPRPSLKVSRADGEMVATKNYGAPMKLMAEDFCYAGVTRVKLEVANGGSGSFRFTVTPRDGELPEWLTIEPAAGEVTDQVEVTLICDRSKLPAETERCILHVSDGDAVAAVEVAGKAVSLDGLPKGTFVQRGGVISMLAQHYSRKKDVPGGAFYRIPDYGKYGSGMKPTPSTVQFTPEEDKPALTYTFLIEQPGDYRVQVLTAPNNPVEIGVPVELMLESGSETRILELIPADFRAGENSDSRWAAGVLNQIHTAETTIPFEPGIRTLTVSPLSPGVVLEKITLTAPGVTTPESYLGPEETVFVQ